MLSMPSGPLIQVLRHTHERSAAISLSESQSPAHFSKLQLDDPHTFAAGT